MRLTFLKITRQKRFNILSWDGQKLPTCVKILQFRRNTLAGVWLNFGFYFTFIVTDTSSSKSAPHSRGKFTHLLWSMPDRCHWIPYRGTRWYCLRYCTLRISVLHDLTGYCRFCRAVRESYYFSASIWLWAQAEVCNKCNYFSWIRTTAAGMKFREKVSANSSFGRFESYIVEKRIPC